MQQSPSDRWGAATLEPGQQACCSVGPLTLTLTPSGSQWHIAQLRHDHEQEQATPRLTVGGAGPLPVQLKREPGP